MTFLQLPNVRDSYFNIQKVIGTTREIKLMVKNLNPHLEFSVLLNSFLSFVSIMNNSPIRTEDLNFLRFS